MILKVEKDVNDSDCGTTVLIIVAAMCQQGILYKNLSHSLNRCKF